MSSSADFRSLVSHIKTTDDIDDKAGRLLMYQYKLERMTSPWEMSLWDEKDLRSFKIDVEKIDRFYTLDHFEIDDCHVDDTFLARMKYKEKEVFVEFSASGNPEDFDYYCWGSIYMLHQTPASSIMFLLVN